MGQRSRHFDQTSPRCGFDDCTRFLGAGLPPHRWCSEQFCHGRKLTSDLHPWQALEEIAAVVFCAEAWVEDGDDASVGGAADEAADALF